MIRELIKVVVGGGNIHIVYIILVTGNSSLFIICVCPKYPNLSIMLVSINCQKCNF